MTAQTSSTVWPGVASVAALRNGLSALTGTAIYGGVVGLLERTDPATPNLLRVLTYHRVAPLEEQPWLDASMISATPDAFDRQMAHLVRHYRVLSLPELIEHHQSRTPVPPRSVLITFDDAYRDFADHAWPILRRHGLPATLFVPTGFPDRPDRAFWWDRLHQALRAAPVARRVETPIGPIAVDPLVDPRPTLKRLKAYVKSQPHETAMRWVDELCQTLGAPEPSSAVLGWDALRQLAREGVSLGAHSRSHPMLSRIPAERAREEAEASQRDLEREIGPGPAVFAYPSGGLNETVVQMLRGAGFVLAFKTAPGINDLADADPLRLRRINVGRRTTMGILRTRLLARARHLNRWQPVG